MLSSIRFVHFCKGTATRALMGHLGSLKAKNGAEMSFRPKAKGHI